ncbi:MAG: DUF1015 domain-containing protein [Actinobacteria bacterium]|nr:DUF1015 domain-containing protein [Actinomycetota bacterium]MBU4241191.1 DUF1015 domain-containing protein [Actinomycetota bacterium]MBU4302662.1 DUF1015 domain-containing protein [Actinomycetota bacterium]MBU4490358.1 DUF1015 domain-containing protein [Actinomycetota bacterium]MCG2794590.1 DUF1015 domain-containing protein [Actinomycetes bacterium]
MADVRPFRGLRYNQEAIGDLSLVVAPPYDVIGDQERDSYYNKHPYNVVRLILNRPKKSDENADAPYLRAGQFLDRWRAQRIMIQDAAPAFYLYRQRYLLEGTYKECTGVAARVRVEEFADGGILPHEDIMPKPLEDRTKLLEYTRTHLSMVQTLYSDPEEKLKAPILSEMERFPLAQFQTLDGIAHDVWGVTDERFTRKLTTFFKKRPLYIADGHHRYQTALEYSRNLRSSGEITEDDDPRNFLLMMTVEMENPGLSLLPVHRVLVGERKVDAEALLRTLESRFTVTHIEVPRGARSGQVYHLLERIAEAGGSGVTFGAFAKDPDRFVLLSWKSSLDPLEVIEGDLSDSYKELDVTALHKVVIEGAAGIPPDRESVQRNILFTRDPIVAVRAVDSGRGSIAFFLNAPRVEQVRDVADHGERMPQKSTYFFPKPCSGVVMNDITTW